MCLVKKLQFMPLSLTMCKPGHSRVKKLTIEDFMKTFILALACLSATVSFAKTENCTFQHLQILKNAKGPMSEQVSELLTLETPNFSCEFTATNLAFAADCGRFIYVNYAFKVQVAATTIEAVVHAGGISCTGEKRIELKKVLITE